MKEESGTTSFRSVKQNRISEEVLSQLKDAILAGTYRPGGKLPSERELCERFEVSRVVIREAIRALELTGFVRLRHGPCGGAYVQDLTLDHLSDAFKDLFLANKLSAPELVQVRLHIEPEVCRLAAHHIDPVASEQLEKAFQEEHTGTLTHEQWVARNLEIHYILGRTCRNRYYEAVLTPLLDLTREMVLVVKPSHRVIHDPRGAPAHHRRGYVRRWRCIGRRHAGAHLQGGGLPDRPGKGLSGETGPVRGLSGVQEDTTGQRVKRMTTKDTKSTKKPLKIYFHYEKREIHEKAFFRALSRVS